MAKEGKSRQIPKTAIHSENYNALNNARLIDSSELISTPSTCKGKRPLKSNELDTSYDSDDENYRIILAASCRKEEKKKECSTPSRKDKNGVS